MSATIINVPVNEITFTVALWNGTAYGTANTVADCESLSIAIDNGIEEWNPMDGDGWKKRMVTAKSLTVSMGGKRNYNDAGNNAIAGCAYAIGDDCMAQMVITFPDGATLSIDGVVSVNSLAGASTDVDALEWELQSNGKPTYTPAA